MDLIKIMDQYMTRGEVACALSHISLWAKCIQQDKPLVVLEHDALMVKPFLDHPTIGTLCYLGGREQAKMNWPVYPTPPHASEGPNYHFICRAHAYSIDPQSAKNLLAYVIKYGLTGPLDIIMRMGKKQQRLTAEIMSTKKANLHIDQVAVMMTSHFNCRNNFLPVL